MRLAVLGLRILMAVLLLIVFCTFGIIAVLLGYPRHKAIRAVLPTWARWNLLSAGLELEIVRGAEHLSSQRPCVFVANHQGLLDAFVFPAILDAPMFYPVKKELVWIPFMGWFAWITRQPRIDRSDPLKAMQAMDEAMVLLRSGLCTLMFPEGTRTRDGKLGEFKKGAFRLSMDSGVPLVPIVLVDCADRMPMGTYQLEAGTIHVVVGEPIETTDWNRKNVMAKIGEVRDQFLATITSERARLGLPPRD